MPDLELVEVSFGAHFLLELTLDPQLGEKLYRQLTKEKSEMFTGRFVQAGAPFLFHHQGTKTQLLLTENNLLFTIRGGHNPEQFLVRCMWILNKLIAIFELNEEAFRVFGKVHRYRLRHSNALAGLKQLLPGFAADPVHTLRIRPSLRQDGKNVHLHFSSAEQDGEPTADTLLLECDINNADQNLGHSVQVAADIVQYADRYQQESLPRMIREKLGLGD